MSFRTMKTLMISSLLVKNCACCKIVIHNNNNHRVLRFYGEFRKNMRKLINHNVNKFRSRAGGNTVD